MEEDGVPTPPGEKMNEMKVWEYEWMNRCHVSED